MSGEILSGIRSQEIFKSSQLEALKNQESKRGENSFFPGIELVDGSVIRAQGKPRVEDAEKNIIITFPGSEKDPEFKWNVDKREREESFCLRLEVINTTDKDLPIEKLILFSSLLKGVVSASSMGWETASPAHPSIRLPEHEHLEVKKHMPESRIGPLTTSDRAEEITPIPWMTQIQNSEQKMLIGFTTAKEQAGFISLDKEGKVKAFNCLEGISLKPGEKISSEELFVSLSKDGKKALEEYAKKISIDMGARVRREPMTGWCSWYQMNWNVNEEDLMGNVDELAEISNDMNLEYVVIDDQFDPKGKLRIGDWLAPSEKFPSGYKKINENIHEKGLKSALWLSPFIASSESHLYLDHPSWFVKSDDGRPVNVKDHWGTENYALDITNPEAQEWLADLMKSVKEQGFDGVKIDFLFLGTARGKRFDEKATGVKALRTGLEIIDKEMKDKFVLYCGSPILPIVGLAEVNRIGPDISANWGTGKKETTSSLKYALRSTWSRKWMDGVLFQNDPDCILVRKNEAGWSEDEMRTWLSTIAMNKVFLLSDDMKKIEPERKALLSYIFPPLQGEDRAEPLEFDEEGMPKKIMMEVNRSWEKWRVAALLNTGDQEKAMVFSPAEWGIEDGKKYHVFDQWSKEYLGCATKDLILPATAPHGTRLLSIHEDKDRPQVVGATLHVLGGVAEITGEKWTGNDLKLKINCPKKRSGEVAIYVPESFSYKGEKGGRVISVKIEAEGETELRLSFEKVL